MISKTSTESNKIRHKNESQLGSIEPSRKTTHNTNEEIANQNVGKCRHKSIYVLAPSQNDVF